MVPDLIIPILQMLQFHFQFFVDSIFRPRTLFRRLHVRSRCGDAQACKRTSIRLGFGTHRTTGPTYGYVSKIWFVIQKNKILLLQIIVFHCFKFKVFQNWLVKLSNTNDNWKFGFSSFAAPSFAPKLKKSSKFHFSLKNVSNNS